MQIVRHDVKNTHAQQQRKQKMLMREKERTRARKREDGYEEQWRESFWRLQSSVPDLT